MVKVAMVMAMAMVAVCVDFMQKAATAEKETERGGGERVNGSIGSNSEKIYGVYKTEKNGSHSAIATAKHQTRIFQRRKMRSQPKMDGWMERCENGKKMYKQQQQQQQQRWLWSARKLAFYSRWMDTIFGWMNASLLDDIEKYIHKNSLCMYIERERAD